MPHATKPDKTVGPLSRKEDSGSLLHLWGQQRSTILENVIDNAGTGSRQ
jgi:hypothetical protein